MHARPCYLHHSRPFVPMDAPNICIFYAGKTVQIFVKGVAQLCISNADEYVKVFEITLAIGCSAD